MAKHQLKMAISVFALSASLGAPALAQTADRPIEQSADVPRVQPRTVTVPSTAASSDSPDIIVTARKREERLQDVPETIQAFSAASLAARGIKTLDDLGHSVSNVTFSRRADNEPNVVIRGVGSLGNVQGVGFYFDGVQNFTDQSTRLVDLERVEVLKGPQGTLYGGSSIGGAVKYITKKPSDVFEGGFSAEVGQYRTNNFTGSLNIPVTSNLAVRLSGYTENTAGYVKNPLTGVNNDDSHGYGAMATVRYTPSAGSELLFYGRYSYLDNGGMDYALTSAVNDYRYVNPLNVNPANRRRVVSGILTYNQDLGGSTLTSTSSYTERRSTVLWDLDYSSLDIVQTPVDNIPQHTPVITEELRLASNRQTGLHWLVGLYAFSARNRGTGLRGDIILGADATGGPRIRIPLYRDASSLDRSYAAFGDLTYTAGPLEITAGARLNRSIFQGRNGNIPAAGSVAETKVLPKLSVSYHTSPDTMVYGIVSEGYEPGKINIIGTALAPYRGETAVNYEAGVKGNIAGRLLTYAVDGFYITNKNRQFETQVMDSTNIPVDITANIGSSRSYGAEASFELKPVSGITVTTNVGYLIAKYKRALFFGQQYNDTFVPNAPKFSGSTSVNYRHPVTDSLTLSTQADLSYSSKFYWDIPNLASQSSYALVGARISLAPNNGPWELAIRADNIFDKGYNTEFYYNYDSDPSIGPNDRNATCNQCHLAHVGAPRSIIGSISYHF